MRLIQLSDLMDIRLPLSNNCNRKWTQIHADFQSKERNALQPQMDANERYSPEWNRRWTQIHADFTRSAEHGAWWLIPWSGKGLIVSSSIA
jgi:hypothetical protein